MSSHCFVRRRFVRLRARGVLLGGAGYFRVGLILCVCMLAAFLSGCPNKTPVATATPPAPPPPPAPVISIEVSPSTVQSGESVTITWKTENASAVTIEPLGAVLPSGSQTAMPTESTTYHLTAKGPGGVQESDARVTVTAAAAQAPSNITEEDLADAAANRLDVFFDSDQYSIRPDQFNTIRNDADFFKQHPELQITVEGHCDELGSTEYNLALGVRRASEVKTALETAGVNAGRIQIISYGKEQPFCNDESDRCMRLNRRAHVVTSVAP
jgi:peptidoglycan-associated lipoprotein